MRLHKLNTSGSIIGLTLLRVFSGIYLSFGHGCNKLGVPWSPDEKELSLFQISDGFVNFIRDDFPVFAFAPLLFAWVCGFTETIVSLFFAAGLLTRWSAALLMIPMAVASLHQWKGGWLSMESSFLFFLIFLLFLFKGGGQLSIDRIWKKQA